MAIRILGRVWRQALAFAAGTTLCLALAPFAWRSSASFLGKDVSQLASGVIDFYPWIAVWEAVRIVVIALALSFSVGTLSAWASRQVRPRRRWLIFPTLPAAAYAAWAFGAALKYPAMFESNLPQRLQTLLYHTSFAAQPWWFFSLAALFIGVPPLTALVHSPPRFGRVVARHPVAVQAAVLLGLAVADQPRAAQASGPAGKPPNVLFIGVDSLRFDRLARAEVTPALGELIRDPQAVLFKDHWVGVPRTFPSWVEMLTGENSPKTGIRNMFPGFAEREQPFPGMAAALAQQGYQTAVVSDFAGDIFPRFEAGFKSVEAPKLTLKTMIKLSVDQAFAGFLPFMITVPLRPLFPALKESPAFADPEHLGAVAESHMTGSAPWLTTVFFSTAHFPYAAPYPYYNRFADHTYTGPFRFEKNPEMGAGEAGPTDADVTQTRALYDGAVRAVDDELGRLFRGLKQRGLWDSTLIVVTADHGEDLYENGMMQGHGEHLRGENVLRVPFILKLPSGQTPATHDVEFTTRSIDIASTVMAAAGAPMPIGDGLNLMPWVTVPGKPAPALSAYSETEIWFTRSGPGFFQKKRIDYPGISGLLSFDQGYTGEIVLNPVYDAVVVTGKHRMWLEDGWKLIYMPTSRGVEYELYDQRRDPANLHDLYGAEPGKAAALKGKLLAFIGTAEQPKHQLIDDFVVPR